MQQTTYITKDLEAVTDAAILNVQGLSSVAFEISGTFSGTVVFEYSINGSSWHSLGCLRASTGLIESSASSSGVWTAQIAGCLYVRIRCSAYTSGTISAYMRAVIDGSSKLSLTASGDAQGSSLDAFNIVKASRAAFDGGTANNQGDYDGTGNPATLFTVTGDVLVGLYGVCTTDLAGASATIEVGVTGNTTLFIPLTTATNIDDGELWMDASPAIGKPIDSLTYYILGDGADIIQTVRTANITGGQLEYICLWKALSAGSTVVAV